MQAALRARVSPSVLTLSTLLVWVQAISCPAQQLKLVPYHDNGMYEIGETVGWTATLADDAEVPKSGFRYTIKKNNLPLLKSGTLDLSSGKAVLETSLDEPGMLYVEIKPPADKSAKESEDDKKRSFIVGAAVAPTKIEPSAPEPADFATFWESKVKALKAIPEKPVVKAGESGKPDVEYATIKMDSINGAHVYGQLAKPKKEGKFPAVVIFQWASPPYPLQKPWVTDRAAEGWLALNVMPHDVPGDMPQAFYDALPTLVKKYESIGNDDRNKSHFVQMYLGDYRALDYITAHPNWDGKTLVVMGTSMGGQQSLAMAGLHPKVTHVIVNEPSGCDTNGPLNERQSPYPNFPSNSPKVMETALYVDTVNFARRIKVPALVSIGFIDTISPPAGVFASFNQIQGPKEAIPMVDSPHNNTATVAQQLPYTRRSAEWLSTLVQGGEVVPDPNWASAVPEALAQASNGQSRPTEPGRDEPPPRADVPAPRTDANSQTAHKQLLEKAKQGKIDVYFVGDSITRRWGTSDAQYKALLENWNENFFGWNAANFGWGGDSTQNILWRLHHGELDGVNPKVIVVQAGTNNIGTKPGDEAQIENVTRGIKAILEVCQAKAPEATIILTAIFPRNDNMAVIPTINKINENIAKFADGKKIRFLNVNDKLADENGRLLDGVSTDRLHLTAKGCQIWADGLKPILTELLGPPAETDQAPPPTGDPSARRPATQAPAAK